MSGYVSTAKAGQSKKCNNAHIENISICKKLLSRKKPATREQVLSALKNLEENTPLVCYQGMSQYDEWCSCV